MNAPTLVLAALLAFVSPPAGDKPASALLGLDPVELCQGRETKGDESIDVVHGRYRYVFASPESRAAFEKDPARYRIQMGGGCGRMGPLSGAGFPGRYAVHDGKVYIFASDGCRKGFLANPEAHLEKPDARPEGSAADREKGNALLSRAAEATGGEKAIAALATYAETRRREVKSGDTDYVNVERLFFSFPGSIRTESAWNDSRWANVVSGDAGLMSGSSEKHAMDESQVAALRHDAARHPVAILKARARPGFVAVAKGTDGGIEKVEVAFDGTTTMLGVDPATGRIVKTWYRGRAGAGPPGPIEVTYSDFRDAGGGLTLPFARHVAYAGKPVDSMSGALESIDVNPALDPALFALE